MTALEDIYIYIVGDIYRYIVRNIYRCIVGDIYRYIVGDIYISIVGDTYNAKFSGHYVRPRTQPGVRMHYVRTNYKVGFVFVDYPIFRTIKLK